MNKIICCLFALVLCSCDSGATQESVSSSLDVDNPVVNTIQEQVSPIDGYFIGVEEMCVTDENGKKHCYGETEDGQSKWYRRRAVTIKGGSVHVVDSPIRIIGQDTLYSASDGGFYYYSGTFIQTDSVYIAEVTLYETLYALPEKVRNPETGEEEEVLTKVWQIKQSGNDLLINGLLYKRSINELQRLKDRVKALRPEKSTVINPKFPLKNILGNWGSKYSLGYWDEDYGPGPLFGITKEGYNDYVADTRGSPYIIKGDSIIIFFDEYYMRQGRIKDANGNNLIIDWARGEKRYERNEK